LAIDDDSGATFLSAEIGNFEIPEDGSYMLLASSEAYLQGTDEARQELDYTLSVAGNVAPSGFEADTVELLATPLAYGSLIEGESSDDVPAALFVFEGAGGDVVDVWVDSDEFPTVLYVFDPEGARLAVDASAVTGLELPEDGVYLILAADVSFYEALQEDTFFVGGFFTLSLEGS
jgi:hypothetical protein